MCLLILTVISGEQCDPWASCLISLGHLSIFFNDALNSFLKNASIIHFKFVEKRGFFKNQAKFSYEMGRAALFRTLY